MCRDSAPRERYQRTCIGVVFGQMCNSRLCTRDTRGRRFATIENLNVNPLQCHTHGRERFSHVRREATWPAQIDIRLAWHVDLVES